MKEFMPNTHIETEGAFIARAYAAGTLSFDDIAESRGTLELDTFDAVGTEAFEPVRRRQEKRYGRRGR